MPCVRLCMVWLTALKTASSSLTACMLPLSGAALSLLAVWDQVLTIEGNDCKAYTQGAEQVQLKQMGTSFCYR